MLIMRAQERHWKSIALIDAIDRHQDAVIGYLDKVKGLGALGKEENALLGLVHHRHQPVHQLPLCGHSHHLTVLFIFRPGMVQQVRVIADLRESRCTSQRCPNYHAII